MEGLKSVQRDIPGETGLSKLYHRLSQVMHACATDGLTDRHMEYGELVRGHRTSACGVMWRRKGTGTGTGTEAEAQWRCQLIKMSFLLCLVLSPLTMQSVLSLRRLSLSRRKLSPLTHTLTHSHTRTRTHSHSHTVTHSLGPVRYIQIT